MKIRISLLFCCLLAAACGDGNSEQRLDDVDIDPSKIIDVTGTVASDSKYFYGDLISEIKIIPLETSENSLISHIMNVTFADNFIYVSYLSSKDRLTLFDLNGNFVKNFPKGKGPADLFCPDNVFFDSKSHTVFINDIVNKKISKYSPSGDFVGCSYYDMIVRDFFVDDDKFVIFQNGPSSFDRNARVFVTDSTFSVESTWVLGNEPYDNGLGSYIQVTDNGVNIVKHLGNVLYTYKDGAVGKKFMYIDNRDKYDFSSFVDYHDLLRNLAEDDCLAMGSSLESKDYLFSCFEVGIGKVSILFYSKTTGEQKFVEGRENSLFNFLSLQGVYSYNDNCFWAILLPYYLNSMWDGSNPNNLISDEDMEKLKSVKEDDNPVIALVKLKK